MSHDAEMDAAMARIGVLRYRLEQADAENARLKAEVEIQNQRINREDKDVAKLYRENARLKADIERLTKAGDAMLSEWCSGDEKDAKNFLKALAIWHAAKGVQS
jgi:chromosome segregation ATPase